MDTLVFTRYLYSKIEVKQALLVALLNRQPKEVLFWTYELYYSGFQDELHDYIVQIHDLLYYDMNPRIHRFIQPLLDEWANDQARDWIFASVVVTLCGLEYDLTEFIRTYFGVKVQIKQPNNSKTQKPPTFRVRYREEDISEYKTVSPTNPRTYLQEGCQYGLHKDMNILFKTEPTRIREEYWYHWHYYAARCPYWKDIMDSYNAKLNHEKACIEFADQEDEEDFNEDWNIEPDEQPVAIQEKSIGTDKNKESYLSIMDFCNKYGITLITQKVKIRPKLPTRQTNIGITNSIAYM